MIVMCNYGQVRILLKEIIILLSSSMSLSVYLSLIGLPGCFAAMEKYAL